LDQLVAAGVAVALLTARSGTPLAGVLTSLWMDGLAERIELDNLSQRETTELLAAGLGGSGQDSSAHRMRRGAGGAALCFVEGGRGGGEGGGVRGVGGGGRWGGDGAGGARLQEVVAARLGRLDPDQLTAMELLAVAGTAPLGVVTALTPVRAVEGLEARALV